MLKAGAMMQSNVKSGLFQLPLFMDMDSASFAQREIIAGD